MLRSHLRQVVRRVGQLEDMQAAAVRSDLTPEEQAQVFRSLLCFCAHGWVERTPNGYRAITDNSGWRQPFEIEPGRWEKRSSVGPEIVQMNIDVAELLTRLFQRTGKYFPVYEGIALMKNPDLVAAVNRYYGMRIFDLEAWDQ